MTQNQKGVMFKTLAKICYYCSRSHCLSVCPTASSLRTALSAVKTVTDVTSKRRSILC